MAKKIKYNIVIRYNSDPDAPSFEEIMQDGVKAWIVKVLKYSKKRKLNSKNDLQSAK